MVRWVGFEIIAEGKMDDYIAWFEARNRRLQELGLARVTIYRVDPHPHSPHAEQPEGKVFFDSPDMTEEEEVHWQQVERADEVIRQLGREVREKGVVVEGSTEFFRLLPF